MKLVKSNHDNSAKELETPRKEENQVQNAVAKSEDHVVSGATTARSGGVLAASYLSTAKAKRLASEANGGPYLNFA